MDPPSVELVRAVILHLVSGRRLIGYHLVQKMKELQIVAEVNGSTQMYSSFMQSDLHCAADENLNVTGTLAQGGFYFDAAHMFTNLSPDSNTIITEAEEPAKGLQTQLPFDTVCQRFLDVKWRKKRSMPFAFTEAKIQMALFQRWRQMHGLSLTRAVLAAKDETLTTVEQAF